SPDMSFETAVAHVLAEEGGWVNDPRDPGGETKYGICKRQYPDIDIKSLTVDDAKAIYLRDYWGALPACLPEPVDSLVFNCGVNCGVGTAIRLLQRAVGTKDDGDWGPKSREALSGKPRASLPALFCAEWARYYALLDGFPRFGRGWMRRVMNALKRAVSE
ncbi:MAG: glycosyl hydrolase 108 family protein, partial [Spongiibacter sp.]|nr:glycosyl hydrolase 108 family protein [Spongiibacter sp.]